MIYEPNPVEAKKIIREKAKEYFPEIGTNSFKVLEVPFGEVSSYALYQYKIVSKNFEKYIIVKFAPIYDNNNEGETEYINLNNLYEKFSRTSTTSRVAKPLDFVSDINALITEKVEGERFNRMLLQGTSKFKSAKIKNAIEKKMFSIGKWLSDFHSISRKDVVVNRPKSVVNVINEKMEIISDYGFPAEIRERITALVERLDNRQYFNYLPIADQHGDFGPQNIVIRDDLIYVFDLQRNHPEVIYNDIAYFIITLMTMNLKLRYLTYDYKFNKRYMESFLEGYFNKRVSEIDKKDILPLKVYLLKNTIERCIKQRKNISMNFPPFAVKVYDSFFISKYYPQNMRRLINEINELST